MFSVGTPVAYMTHATPLHSKYQQFSN